MSESGFYKLGSSQAKIHFETDKSKCNLRKLNQMQLDHGKDKICRGSFGHGAAIVCKTIESIS